MKVQEVTSLNPQYASRQMTQERMQQEYEYTVAQKLTENLLKQGLISDDEFNKISALNAKTFSPYLAELMP